MRVEVSSTMATHHPTSNSPQPSLLHFRTVDPTTPLHSAHPSVSSTSSRTPLHPLSLHEYRKQQKTPTPVSATPPGKTLRRKGAASALNGLERVSSASKAPVSFSRSSLLSLHSTKSAPRLSAYQPLPPSPPPQQDTETHNLPFRSQSAEPRSSRGLSSRYPSTNEAENFYRDLNSTPQVSNWKPIKRLPKPEALPNVTPHVIRKPHVFTSTSRASGTSPAHQYLLPVQTCSSSDNLRFNQDDSTPSTLSLSRFPHPPHLLDPSFSPPNDENAAPRVNISFTTTAPATPPATPAVIHYRGTSFDVVNPHASLFLHDIVTPTRDSISPEYSIERTSEDPLFEPLSEPEMAPKRPLYEDFSRAHSIITRRPDGTIVSPAESQLTLPTLPDPVALGSKSPDYSSIPYDSQLAVSPLKIRKPSESRFSLKSLTRSFTKHLAKSPEASQQELDEFPSSPVEQASQHLEGDYPRALDQSYRSAPSLMRDSSSPEIGRGASPRISMSEGDLIDNYLDDVSIYPPSSIYTADGGPSYPPSLADKRRSNQQRMSRYVSEYQGEIAGYDAYAFADSRRASARASRASCPKTFDPYRATPGAPADHTDTLSKFVTYYEGPTDLEVSDAGLPNIDDQRPENFTTSSGAFQDPARPHMAHASSGMSKFEFDFNDAENPTSDATGDSNVSGSRHTSVSGPITPANLHTYRRNPVLGRTPGDPPSSPPPTLHYPQQGGLRRPEVSDAFSGMSSYGDTRQLLHLSQPLSTVVETPTRAHGTVRMPQNRLEPSSSYSQPDAAQQTSSQGLQSSSSYSQQEGLHPSNGQGNSQGLQPSSSYSQPEVPNTPTTPQEALDHAEQIFDEADDLSRELTKEEAGIPCIWTRRSSGNYKSRKSAITNSVATADDADPFDLALVNTVNSQDDRDWETIGRETPDARLSLGESTADYSDDDSLPEFSPTSPYEVDVDENRLPQESSQYYRRPSGPDFGSSPPYRPAQSSMSMPEESSPIVRSTRESTTMPSLFQSRLSYRNHQDHYRPVPNVFGQLSDRETQELLNSGPNEEIIYEGDFSSVGFGREDTNLSVVSREDTVGRLIPLGRKGNLTGTPDGTGMREVGSSIADNSSPGAVWDSTPVRDGSRQTMMLSSDRMERESSRAPFSSECSESNSNFFRSPLSPGISSSQLSTGDEFSPDRERAPSAQTLFPRHSTAYMKPNSHSSLDGSGGQSLSSRDSRLLSKNGLSPRSSVGGRPAVAGQTKLREMMLASNSTINTRFSRFMGGSTSAMSDVGSTNTSSRLQALPKCPTSNLATELSPHLLCPERDLSPEVEHEQLNKSKFIFICFCLLPPLLLLYHKGLADWIITGWSKGKIPGCHPRYKRIAKWAGYVASIVIAILVLVPVFVARAYGRL